MTDFKKKYDNSLLQYTALATQLLISISIGFYVGHIIDKKMSFTIPLFIWLLPLLIFIIILFKIIKDTSKK